MTLLDEGIALRDSYLMERGLDIKDFQLNYCFAPRSPGDFEWFKEFNIPFKLNYKRFSLPFVYQNPQGDEYLKHGKPYLVARQLGVPKGVPEGEEAPKILSPYGRHSEAHFEPWRDGTSWENAGGRTVLIVESYIKAKVIHKYLPEYGCIGLNGVNGWSSAKEGMELIFKYSGLDFSKFDLIILFDSNTATNPLVQKARQGLCHKLRHILNCDKVSCANLPPHTLKDGSIENWGPDDFLTSMGAAALKKIIEGSDPYQDEEFAELVEEMNKVVIWDKETHGVYDRRTRRLMKVADARNEFMNINRTVLSGKSKKVVFGIDVWLKSGNREEVDCVGYRYLSDEIYWREDQRIANLYIEDGIDPSPNTLTGEDIILRVLQRLFAPSDLELIRTYVRLLKYTGDKPTSYPVLWSTLRGVGKGWFVRLVSEILGHRHVAFHKADLLAEKFNSPMVNKRLVIFNEFKTSNRENKMAALNELKNFIADEIIAVRGMYKDAYSAESRSGVIITGNEKSEVPSDGLEDRRQWYVQCFKGMEPEECAEAWNAFKDKDMMSKAARWFLDGESEPDFQSWRPPMTEERAEDLISGLPSVAQFSYRVRLNLKEVGIRILDAKTIRLLVEREQCCPVTMNAMLFSSALREAHWRTAKKFERVTDSKSAGWFVDDQLNLDSVSEAQAREWLKEDVPKALGGKY